MFRLLRFQFWNEPEFVETVKIMTNSVDLKLIRVLIGEISISRWNS